MSGRENVEAHRERSRRYYEKNKERVLARTKERAENNKELKAAYDRARYASVREDVRERQRFYYDLNKTDFVRKAVARDKRVRCATPPWADPQKIVAMYRLRDELTDMLGVEHHVDHIIPLRGKSVCGLHVHTNLQVIPAKENLQKRNAFHQEEEK